MHQGKIPPPSLFHAVWRKSIRTQNIQHTVIITWWSDQTRFHKTKPLLSYQVRWELSNGTSFIHLRDVEKKLENCPGNGPERMKNPLKWSFFGPYIAHGPLMITKFFMLADISLLQGWEKKLNHYIQIWVIYEGYNIEKITTFARWLINM